MYASMNCEHYTMATVQAVSGCNLYASMNCETEPLLGTSSANEMQFVRQYELRA